MRLQILSILFFISLIIMSLSEIAQAQCGEPPLPCYDEAISDSTLFSISNRGTGGAGFFRIFNLNSHATALRATTNGKGPALFVKSIIGGSLPPIPTFQNTTFRATTFRTDGRAGLFEIIEPKNSSPAVEATTVSTSAKAFAILGIVSSDSTGSECAAVRGINKCKKVPYHHGQFTEPTYGLWGTQEGHGFGVFGESKSGVGVQGEGRVGVRGEGKTGISGLGRSEGHGVVGYNYDLQGSAGTFIKGPVAPPTTMAAVQIVNNMHGGEAAWLSLNYASNNASVMKLVLHKDSNSNFFEGHRPDGDQKFRINGNGTFISGSDFAEALPARGRIQDYEPGDVLVMASESFEVEKTSESYSSKVVGVYSTRPGILGAGKEKETRVDPDDVPVAIMGIVPTKVTAQNGPIHIGDLLVTSSLPGYAMKARPKETSGIETYPTGAILGKALETWEEGVGMIKVLVMLR